MTNRYSLYPIKHRRLFDLYDTQVRALWTPHEIDFSKDIDDLKKMKNEERHLVLSILAFFAQSDSIVNENLATRFSYDVEIPEAKQFYAMQIGIEAIHADTYGRMIDAYVDDDREKNKLFDAIKHYPMIKKKAEWMQKWISSQDSFSERLLAFALVEGVFFAGSFCTIYWLKDRGLLKGLSMANDLIARDEGLHWMFAAELYKELSKMNQQVKSTQFFLNTNDLSELTDEEIGKKWKKVREYQSSMLNNQEFKYLDPKKVEEITKEAVEMEKEFITESLKTSLLGLNKDLMGKYIESQADIVLKRFELNPIYGTKQPFDFMIKNDVQGKVNFFEDRATEYQKGKREKVDFSSISDDF